MAIALAGEGEFSFFGGFARASLGWALAHDGRPEEGVDEALQGIAIVAGRGGASCLPHMFTCLGEAQSLAGRAGEAQASFLRALEVSSAEAMYRPLTLLCRGEHYLRLGEIAAGCDDRAEAAALAERFGALSHALRALTGLARLEADTANVRSLTGLLVRFRGGEDPKDLREARALLARLAALPA